MDKTKIKDFPYEVEIVVTQENQELMEYLKDFTSDFIRIGPKKYFMPKLFLSVAANIYNFPLSSHDTFVVTYPKSGTTLTQELVWLLCNNLDYEKAQSINITERFPFLEISSMIGLQKLPLTDDHRDKLRRSLFLITVEELKEIPSPRFIKSHLPLSLLPPTLLATTKVVYVARDPRDVAFSFYKFHKFMRMLSPDKEFKIYWNYFISNDIVWSPYFGHVLEAWEKRNHPNMLFLFYEDMIKDLAGAIRRVASFYGKALSEEQINRLVDHLDIDNFRKNKSVNMQELKELGIFTSDGDFIRKGKSGGWRDHFDAEMTAQADEWIAEHLRDTDLRFPHCYFPYNIEELDTQENEELNGYIRGYKEEFLRVGPKKYFLQKGYLSIAANIYNFPLRSDDTFIITYPKSGTTLCQELVWLICNNLDYEKAAATILNKRFPFLEVSALVPADKLNLTGSQRDEMKKHLLSAATVEEIREMPSPRLVKSHMPLSLLPPSLLDIAKVVYMIRDPRDIAVSYYHHLQLMKMMKPNNKFKPFWNNFISDNSMPGEWLEYFDAEMTAQADEWIAEHLRDTDLLVLSALIVTAVNKTFVKMMDEKLIKDFPYEVKVMDSLEKLDTGGYLKDHRSCHIAITSDPISRLRLLNSILGTDWRTSSILPTRINSRSAGNTPASTASAAELAERYAFDEVDTRDIFPKHLAARSPIDNACCAKDRLASIVTPRTTASVTCLIELPPNLITGGRFLSLPFSVIVCDLLGANASRLRRPQSSICRMVSAAAVSIALRVSASIRIVTSSAYATIFTPPGSGNRSKSSRRTFHKVGPSTDPCGHPMVDVFHRTWFPAITNKRTTMTQEQKNTMRESLMMFTMSEIESMASPRFIKSHLPLSLLPPSLLDKTKVVYVIRDPRDVAVSFYHHLKLMMKVPTDYEFKKYWECFISDIRTTLTQELVWLVCNNLDYQKAKSSLLNERFPFLELSGLLRTSELSFTEDQVDLLKKSLIPITVNELEEMPSPRFIKSHLPLSLLPQSLLDKTKVVYVARDPRDVAVSFYHHHKLMKMSDPDMEFKKFWKYFVSDLVVSGPFFEHVLEAWEKRNHPNMLFLFYEEITKDLPGAIQRVGHFFGKTLSDEQVNKLAQHLDFNNFKKNKSVNMESLQKVGVFTSDGAFIRKGKSGGWREFFNEEMTAQADEWIAKHLRDTDLRIPNS
nr:uncharacterized protein LOC117996417 [Maniola hyperantus]